MGVFFVYILKSGIGLILFYLFYRLLLSKETFHRFNRITLLVGMVLAMILPAIKLPSFAPGEQETMPIQLAVTEEAWIPATEPIITPEVPYTPLFIYILFAVYGVGVVLFFLKTAGSFINMFRLISTTRPPLQRERFKIHITDEIIAPFSWMNRIIISRKDWQENGEEILLHEAGHVQNLHSWDLLLSQLWIIFHWFNPAVWLIKQELQDIHEFEADSYVLQKGINKKQYQLLLVKKAVGSQRFTSMANSFNHSKLNKRITMMSKSKSSPWAYLKYLYILPVSVAVSTAFASPEIAGKFEQISDAKISDFFQEKKTEPELKLTAIAEEAGSDTIQIRGTVSVEQPIFMINAEESSEEEFNELFPNQLEKIEAVVEDLRKEEKNGAVTITDQSAGDKDKSHTVIKTEQYTQIIPGSAVEIKVEEPEKQPLFIVDGKKVSPEEFHQLTAEKIQEIDVLKDGAAIEQYKEEGKNGVVLIKTKSVGNKRTSKVEVNVGSEMKIMINGPADPSAKVKQRGSEADTSAGEENKHINIEFRENTTNKDSVIVIRAKALSQSENAFKITSSAIKIKGEFKDENILYIIDGKEATKKEFQDLQSRRIKSITVLKGNDAVKEYGDKGKNGVIIVKTAPDEADVVQIKVALEEADSIISEVKNKLRTDKALKVNLTNN